MHYSEWLTANDTQALKKQGAPLRYIKALAELKFRPQAAKVHDYTPRFSIFVECSARRTLKGAQRALFEMVELMTPTAGTPRSIKDPTGGKAIWKEWSTVPGWNMSISADQYPHDPEWYTTALLIHRRFADRASQAEMAKQVKVVLWGPEPEDWPSRLPYRLPAPVFIEDERPRNPIEDLFADLQPPEVPAPPAKATGPSLEPYFIYD